MSKLTALASMAGPVSGSPVGLTFLSVVPSVTSLYEGDTVSFTVNTIAAPDGTVMYYTINQITGTISSSTFTTGSMSGSFTVNNNIGTFSLPTAAEDGNTTTDTFTVNIRPTSITDTVKLTSAAIKIVDLTTYNAAVISYNSGFGGQTLSYSIGATSTAAGNKSTATFQGITITGNGGAAGVNGGYAAGGTYAGGDGGVNGGQGSIGVNWIGNGGRAGGAGTAGGGGAPANNAGGYPAQDMGGWFGTTSAEIAASNSRMNGMWTFLTTAGYSLNITGPARSLTTTGNFAVGAPGNYFGGGGAGYAMTQNLTVNNAAYNKANGGAGGMGGGGGGAGVATKTDYLGVYTYTTQAGGAGGAGGVIVQYNDGIGGAVITSGTSRTIPAGVTKVKVWVIGGGGGGKSSTSSISTGVYGGSTGGGGGGGGTAWKTWTFSTPSPTKPSL
jgi:hypothetical protein